MKRPSLLNPADPTTRRTLDKEWKYVNGESTDIRKTFARIKRQQKEETEAKAAANVKPIRQRSAL